MKNCSRTLTVVCGGILLKAKSQVATLNCELRCVEVHGAVRVTSSIFMTCNDVKFRFMKEANSSQLWRISFRHKTFYNNSVNRTILHAFNLRRVFLRVVVSNWIAMTVMTVNPSFITAIH